MTPGLAHHGARAQHPALSSELKFANFKEKLANRVSPASSHSTAPDTSKRLLLNEDWLSKAEAEQEAEVTISSQHAGWSLPSPPCNSPWLEGTHPELASAFPSSGVFPNSQLLLGSCLAPSQQLFPLHHGKIFFCQLARSDTVPTRHSFTSPVRVFKARLG